MHYFLDSSVITLISKLIFSALFGSMIFFTIIVAPTVFKNLNSVNSRKFLRSIFPKLYMWGIVISFFNCLILIDDIDISFLISLLIFFGFLFSRQILIPKINSAADRSNESDIFKKKFKNLHSFSVLIFITQLVLIIFYFFII